MTLFCAFTPQKHNLGPLVWVYRKTCDSKEADGIISTAEVTVIFRFVQAG